MKKNIMLVTALFGFMVLNNARSAVGGNCSLDDRYCGDMDILRGAIYKSIDEKAGNMDTYNAEIENLKKKCLDCKDLKDCITNLQNDLSNLSIDAFLANFQRYASSYSEFGKNFFGELDFYINNILKNKKTGRFNDEEQKKISDQLKDYLEDIENIVKELKNNYKIIKRIIFIAELKTEFEKIYQDLMGTKDPGKFRRDVIRDEDSKISKLQQSANAFKICSYQRSYITELIILRKSRLNFLKRMLNPSNCKEVSTIRTEFISSFNQKIEELESTKANLKFELNNTTIVYRDPATINIFELLVL